ncbi:MAG: hypothetical protein AAFQ51_06205 [Pseudomonadota bacterium]
MLRAIPILALVACSAPSPFVVRGIAALDDRGVAVSGHVVERVGRRVGLVCLTVDAVACSGRVDLADPSLSQTVPLLCEDGARPSVTLQSRALAEGADEGGVLSTGDARTLLRLSSPRPADGSPCDQNA